MREKSFILRYNQVSKKEPPLPSFVDIAFSKHNLINLKK